jgi:hypothetical protein
MPNMSNDNIPYQKFDHDEYARSCDPDDLLAQTRRTVKGKPVSDEQIGMIVETIRSKLEVTRHDVLLELACGNGSISKHLFESCGDYLGVDFSEFLISVAKKNFEKLPHYAFTLSGAAEYVRQESNPDRFTKVLCYAGFCYFPPNDAVEVLQTLNRKFSNVQRVFVGNLPDRDRADAFYREKRPSAQELSDNETAIGTWRTKNEFATMCENAGWRVQFSAMPPTYFSSYYRFDALLTR